MTTFAIRRLLTVTAMTLLVAGCAKSTYPLVTSSDAHFAAARGLHEPVQSLVLVVQPKPGDRIDFLAATAVNLPEGVSVRWYYSPPVVSDDGRTHSLGVDLPPLPGAAWAVDAGASPGPNNDVAVIAELTAERPGTYTLDLVRLSFRLNGGPVEVKDGITQSFRLCATDPRPASPGDCPVD